MLTVDEVISKAQFESLQAHWDGLLQKSDRNSPFLTHDWFRCCFDNYGDKKDVFILLVKDGANLIGIAPLWRYVDSVRKIPIRRLDFILAPDTPFVDFIIQTGQQHQVLECMFRYLFTEKKDMWDLCALTQWPTESPNHEVLQDVLKKQSSRFFIGQSSLTPYISIQGKWEAFLQTRSARFRKTRRNITNRVSRLKNVEVLCFRDDTSGEAFKQILAISERSWKHKQGIAITSDERLKRFFATVTGMGSRRGWLLNWLLKIDGAPVAMEYDLEHEGRVYALRADFDESYSEYSPGAYLEYQIVKQLFEQGYREYSTGPGTNTYKLHWTDELWQNGMITVCNHNTKGRLIWVLEDKLLPCMRHFRDRVMVLDGAELKIGVNHRRRSQPENPVSSGKGSRESNL